MSSLDLTYPSQVKTYYFNSFSSYNATWQSIPLENIFTYVINILTLWLKSHVSHFQLWLAYFIVPKQSKDALGISAMILYL